MADDSDGFYIMMHPPQKIGDNRYIVLKKKRKNIQKSSKMCIFAVRK